MIPDPTTFLQSPYNTWPPDKILDYFQNRQHIHYFPVRDLEQTTPQKIENILQNRFDFNDELYHLPPPINWLHNPSTDVEWQILLHKFYYAVGLGALYAQTGDPRYAHKWRELTESWIDTVPFHFRTTDVVGRRVQNWIFAHYYFVTQTRPPDLTSTFYLKFLHSLHQQVEHLRHNLTPARNHRTIELYAIFLTAVVFPEFCHANEWLEFSRAEILKNMETDLLTDGVQYELSTDYHHLVLKNYLGIRRLAKMNNIPVPPRMDELLQKALHFAIHAHKPDGQIPSFSDGDARSFLDLLEQGYELYQLEELRYVATQGREGHKPAHRAVAFPDSGYYILRSGWGETESYVNERYLMFDCGPLGAGNHGHLDLLSFEMAAYGESLVVDPGRYTYDESGPVNWRVLFRGTSYHNTVQVDGHNQARYIFHKTRYKIRGPYPSHELKAFVIRDQLDFLWGAARSHEYDAVHERQIFFADRTYFVILDLLQADTNHTYDLRFHLSDKAWKAIQQAIYQDTYLIQAPHLLLAHPLDGKTMMFIEDGFVSRTYGVKHPAPVVRFSQQAQDTRFVTVLFPYARVAPRVSVAWLPVQQDERVCGMDEAVALVVTVTHNGRFYRDFFFCALNQQPGQYQFGPFLIQGWLAHIRQADNGQVLYHTGESELVSIVGQPLPDGENFA
ncbi:MAG: hypothetical protein D6706_00610 [Chloroflexi bacterium]|nr:MAG: hypothetical protein D6706_00610 [Chloroflexota bacterium]